MTPNLLRFSEILMFLRKEIFEILLLVKIKVLNYFGKSLTLAPCSTGTTIPLLPGPLKSVCTVDCSITSGVGEVGMG